MVSGLRVGMVRLVPLGASDDYGGAGTCFLKGEFGEQQALCMFVATPHSLDELYSAVGCPPFLSVNVQ